MNIYVLRHGQTDYNVQGKFQGQIDVPINKQGIEQAKKVAEELKQISFDVILSSPLKRAIQTAEIVNDKNIIIDERLIERSFGKLEGKYSIENYEERVEEFQIETIEQLRKRVYEFLDEISIKYQEADNILVVTHACISDMIEQYFNNKLRNIGDSTLKNGEYKKYSIDNNKMSIEEIEKLELQREDKLPKQKFSKKAVEKQELSIVYLMVWTKICGGSKIILEYANRLSMRGHKITIITYDKKPTWFSLNENIKFIQLNVKQKIENNIPKCDLIVATSWKNIYSAIKANCAPVVYFEQGGSHIFDINNLEPIKRKVVKQRISEVEFIYTVSNDTKRIINEQYGKEAFVVPNAVDESIFYADESKNNKRAISITTIGPEEFSFKHIDNIIEAVKIIKQKHKNIEFNWITQTEPKKHKDIKAIINPKQMLIGDILRNTDIYICASDYESFGLPVLEAMTCGAAIITTDNGGISDFVTDKENGLIINKNDIQDIVNKIEILIQDREYMKYLANNAKKASKNFNWDKSVMRLEQYYRQISQYEIE